MIALAVTDLYNIAVVTILHNSCSLKYYLKILSNTPPPPSSSKNENNNYSGLLKVNAEMPMDLN